MILLLVDIVLGALEPPKISGCFPHLSVVMKFLFQKMPKQAQEHLSLELCILEKEEVVTGFLFSSLFF